MRDGIQVTIPEQIQGFDLALAGLAPLQAPCLIPALDQFGRVVKAEFALARQRQDLRRLLSETFGPI